MDIKKYLSQRKKIIDDAIPRFIPKRQKPTGVLHDAVKYPLMTGGKRIRPILTLASCEAVSGAYKKAIPLAVAIEMIHTYTLVHDDLPAMDNDDLRRGKPTCHKKFGEDVAILAGDMLNTLAFEIIARNYRENGAEIIAELSACLGINGVVGGQLADLKAGRNIGIEQLNFISIRKTAALFIAAAVCGGMAGAASRDEMSKLRSFAGHLGLAFQIIDDILDYGSESKTGYPALLGMKGSKLEAGKQVNSAIKALPGSKNYGRLKEIAVFLTDRKE